MANNDAIAAQFSAVRYGPARLVVPLTIFSGALLLFAVEPLIAKMILPWFGGSAEVWITCLLFFQAALLVGYLYAHVLTTRVAPAWQWRTHLFLLTVSLLFLPIIPSERWKPAGGEEPLPFILALLAATIGLPFVLLSATGPLTQAWLSRSHSRANAGHQIYRLYALSNLGSLIALLSYPVLIEPWLPTRQQAWSWSLIYLVFALLSAVAAWTTRNAIAEIDRTSADDEPKPKIRDRVLWFVLALCASATLLGATNHMLRNIAAIPLLWVLPLSLYLLSFIICFDSPRWYYRPAWYALFTAASSAMIYYARNFFVSDYVAQLALFNGGLFVICMVCHGELASLKPSPRHLTAFYLTIAAGGAAGGLLIAAVAPVLLRDDYDLALLLPSVTLLVIWLAWRRIPAAEPAWLRWSGLLFPLYLWLFLTGSLALYLRADLADILVSVRNFYGPLRVTLRPATATSAEIIMLRNGNIVHGREFTAEAKRCEPVSYYAPASGIGLAIGEMGKNGPLNVGVIGLGAGTIAGYGRAGDVYRFYEINPQVRDLATRTFHYLSCPAQSSVELGDARLSLERENPRNFDVLALDAFTGDAIPVHLLTTEAFQLYWRHLKPDGILAVHVSNRYVDLAPIVARAAEENGKFARLITNVGDDVDVVVDGSYWVLVSANADFFSRLPAQGQPIALGPRAWTDDYSNLWQSLR
ncbi:MAG TPA: fused MFS/spermidine synthase [Micropepsaceae bacterium]|nr:fused MFS/spermidine synthase [Micropepsaceae bacterium]